jgi:hypothetical protein
MKKEALRHQRLAGIITEGEYKKRLDENNTKSKVKAYFLDMANNSPENLASVLAGLVMGEEPTYEDFVRRVMLDIKEGGEYETETPNPYLEKMRAQFGDSGSGYENAR